MPFLAYFLFVGTILMGTMAFSEIAISPPLTFNATSQILPQKASPKIPAARDVSPPRSKTLASAKFTKKTKLARKHKTTNKVARSKANSSDGNYHMRFAHESYGRAW
jgi:hypothetical protein